MATKEKWGESYGVAEVEEDESPGDSEAAGDSTPANDERQSSDRGQADDREDSDHLRSTSHRKASDDRDDDAEASDERKATGDEKSAGEPDRSLSDVAAATEAAGDADTSSDRRFGEIGLDALNPDYARVTSGIEYLRSTQDNLNAHLGFNISNIPEMSERKAMNLNVSLMGREFSAGIGQSSQHQAVDDAMRTFGKLAHASGNDDMRNFWEATGIADGILSKYQVTYENLEAKAAYQTDHLDANPQFKDLIYGGERDILAKYHAELRDAFRDYANGDVSQANATQRALNAIDGIEKYMDHIGLTDTQGNIDDARTVQYESDRKDLVITALQHELAERNGDRPMANFANEDGLSQFVAGFDHMTDDQKATFTAAALQGRIMENLNLNLPESGDANGVNAMRDALVADYPTLFQESMLQSGEALNHTKDQYDAILAKTAGFDFKALDADQFQAEEIERLMEYLKDSGGDSGYAGAVSALDDQGMKDLVDTMGVQAAEYWNDAEGDRDQERAMDHLSALNALFMASNDEAKQAWTDFMADHGYETQLAEEPAGDSAAATHQAAADDSARAGDADAANFPAPDEYKHYAEGIEPSWGDRIHEIYSSSHHNGEIKAMLDQIPDSDPDRVASEYFYNQANELYSQHQAGNAEALEQADRAFSVVENILGAHDNTAEEWQEFKIAVTLPQMAEAAAAS